jgi:hypothetical protein
MRTDLVARLGGVLVILAASGAAQPSPEPTPPSDCVRKTIGPVVMNVPSVRVRPRFLLNGRPFPQASAGSAVITLWASEPSPLFDGPQLSLGETHLPPKAVRVVPGVYDVYYSWQSGGRIPRNEQTRIMRRVSIHEDGELVVDVPMVRLRGFKRHNGKPFADDRSSAQLSLQRADGRGSVPLGGIRPSPFTVRVIPGHYTFRYQWQAGATIPHNRRATVGAQLALETDQPSLVLNVPSVAQDFTFLNNGAPFPSADIESGQMVLSGRGDEVALGPTHEPPSTIRIIPGNYQARFRHVAGGSIVPRNADGLVDARLSLNGSPRVIDVPSLEVSGQLLVAGAVPPNAAIENARLHAIVPGSQDRVVLGEMRYGAYQVRLIPGRYDVEYEHLAGGALVLPTNPRAILARDWDVSLDPGRTFDVPVGRYHGTLLLNGEPFPASDIELGHIYALPNARDRSPVFLGPTRYGAYDRLVLPGSYQPAFAHVAGATIVPRNTLTTYGAPERVRRGDTGEAAVLDLFAADLVLSYEHNGAPMPVGGPDVYQVRLHRGVNDLQLHDSVFGPFNWKVMEGTFDLFYQYRGGPGLPKNAFMRFGCWELVRDQSPASDPGIGISR